MLKCWCLLPKVILVLLVVFLSTCNLPDIVQDGWILSGDVLFQGTPASDVLLSAYYTYEYTFYKTSQGSVVYPTAQIVSGVANLGITGGAFSLQFATSQLSPSDSQYIYLIMWIDTNANNLYDAGEEWNYAIPRYGDPTFQNAYECSYYYSDHYNDLMGTEPGWNQSIGFIDYEPVHFATMTGAKISNEYAWY